MTFKYKNFIVHQYTLYRDTGTKYCTIIDRYYQIKSPKNKHYSFPRYHFKYKSEVKKSINTFLKLRGKII